MGITYFLALPLNEQELSRFLSSAKRWAFFLNQELYLSLISYRDTPYLAKEVSSFPCSIESWQRNISHVSSLLKHTFLCPSLSDFTFLACTQYKTIDLENLTK
ncbi:hypothetical protein [Chlamydia vaughanii]|uniref:hypothetical protein n=1 Tax=Chlamydia vaughanii TaxID=3112552 RepID=UPI0032B250A9